MFNDVGVVQAIIVAFVGHHAALLIGSNPQRNSMIGSSIPSIQMRIYLQHWFRLVLLKKYILSSTEF